MTKAWGGDVPLSQASSVFFGRLVVTTLTP
jgi:hypothetical protein